MARVQKSLPAPEYGYPHREHRSKRGRTPWVKYKRHHRKVKQERIEKAKKRDERKDLSTLPSPTETPKKPENRDIPGVGEWGLMGST